MRKNVNTRRQMCVVMQHVNFDDGQLLHSVSCYCKVEREGATEHSFNDTIQDDPEGGGDVAAAVREEEFLVEVQEILKKTHRIFVRRVLVLMMTMSQLPRISLRKKMTLKIASTLLGA